MKSTKKIMKVEFDLNKEEDKTILGQMETLLRVLDSHQIKKKLKLSDLFKEGVKKLKKEDLKPLIRSLMNGREVLNLWTTEYNREHQMCLTSDEFAVQILPTMKVKELQKLEESLWK